MEAASSSSTMIPWACAGVGMGIGASMAAACCTGSGWRKLPPPSQCPAQGVRGFAGLAGDPDDHTWVFMWNHFADLEFFNEHVFEGVVRTLGVHAHSKPRITYPVRMLAAAGFRREWSFRGGDGAEAIGDQTVTRLVPTRADAHDMVGVVVCIPGISEAPEAVQLQSRMVRGSRGGLVAHVKDVDASCFEWLAPMDNRWLTPGRNVRIVYYSTDASQDTTHIGAPTLRCPILQSHVDSLLNAALPHGELFAAEWLSSINKWSSTERKAEGEQKVSYWLNDREQPRRPWLCNHNALCVDRLLKENVPDEFGCRAYEHEYGNGKELICNPALLSTAVSASRATRRVVKNFMVGFGSIINTKSRASDDPSTIDAAPCRISAEFGYVREWNFQASTAQICALGLRRCKPGEKGATINGVICACPDDMTSFDRRENGYRRVAVPADLVELLSWQRLPEDAQIFVYVPYAPQVVQKYGTDAVTGLPRCSGLHVPAGLDDELEGAGLGLSPPSARFPILQSYVDVCISGCLEYSEDFAREFIETTFLWSPYWLNERELARRPWLRERSYVQIDSLLQRCIPDYFKHRRLESEYAAIV